MLGEAVLAIENLYSRAIMKNDKSKTEKEISKPDTNLSGSGSQLPAANSAKHEPSANQTESLIKNSEQIIFKTEESLTPIYSLNTVPVNEKLKVVQDYMTDLLHLLSKVEIVVNEKKKIGTQKKKLNK